MTKSERTKALKERAGVMKEHPAIAKVVLAQQAMLMEASELGFAMIPARMCKLLELGLAMPFLDYWEQRCKAKPRPPDVGGVIGCLASARNPANCFSLAHEDEWFDDPLAGGRTLPPKPPIPPLQR